MSKFLGIDWVPLDEPLERRIQTIAVATTFCSFAFGGFIGLYLTYYLIFYTRFWWLVALYLAWIYTLDSKVEDRGGRECRFMRSFFWYRLCRDYFPIKLEVRPKSLDPKKNYLFCGFPHGVFCTGPGESFVTTHCGAKEKFPNHKINVTFLDLNFKVPFIREYFLSLGMVAASADSINYLLGDPNGGRICVLFPGGAYEAYFARPGHYEFFVKKRKGFIKLALKNGAPLVPVISFGETDLFDQIGADNPTFRRIQEWLRKWVRAAPIVIVGRGFLQNSFGIIPRRKPVNVVVGEPLDVPKIPNPTNEDIEEYHKKFVDALVNLFEEEKHKYVENHKAVKAVIC